MPSVSVARLESLDEALAAVVRAGEAMGAAAHSTAARLAAKRAEAEREVAESRELFEAAVQLEANAAETVEAARDRLASAESARDDARADLFACESQDEDEDGNRPTCWSEESAFDAAEAEVAQAEEGLGQATAAHERAKAQRARLEQRAELARRAVCQLGDDEVSFRAATAGRLQRAAEIADAGRQRVGRARAALDAYLTVTPPAASFAAWLGWSPQPNSAAMPVQLRDRLDVPAATLGHFLGYLAERDPAFGRKAADYRARLAACTGPAERHALQLQVRKTFAGAVAEQLAVRAFGPLAERVAVQRRVDLPDGRYTVTDVVLEGLKVPIIFGRGEGRSAGAGASVSLEVKCGRADYLRREKEHMTAQARGHGAAGASLTVCSRDVKDLAPDEEEELRAALRSAGSTLIGLLPRKEEIDRACWEFLTTGAEVPE